MKVSVETRKAILKAKQDGTAIKDICSKFELSKATVHRVLQTGKVDLPETANTIIPTIPEYETKSIEFSRIIQGGVR